jgi:integrase
MSSEKTSKRARGHIFKYPKCRYWYIKYHRVGRAYVESSRSERRKDAEKLLNIRMGEIAQGKFRGLDIEKVKFEELVDIFVDDYENNKRKSMDRAERTAKQLSKFFYGIRAIDITTDRIQSYIELRRKDGVQDPTINRELSGLKRMFSLAKRITPPKVNEIPYIPHLKENRPRQGFFEHEEYRVLTDALSDYLRPVMTMAYYTGMRKGEILSLKWRQVNLLERKITLDAGTTKNDEGRIVFMTDELYEALVFQRTIRDNNFPQCESVFFNYKTGRRIKDFRNAWNKAIKETGLEGKLFHDFRRTGVRNLTRSGVSENVAMQISGHKTRSIFDRYDIVDEADLKRASEKVSEYQKSKEEGLVRSLVRIDGNKENERNNTIQ